MVPQVDKEQMTVVTLAMHPAREANRFTDIALTQFGAGMGTIDVHDEVGSLAQNLVEKRAPRFTVSSLFVNPPGHG
jgi:hypothetical protein